MRTFIGLPFTCCLIGLDPPNQVLVPLFRQIYYILSIKLLLKLKKIKKLYILYNNSFNNNIIIFIILFIKFSILEYSIY
jgi:hypothetical protein